MMPLSAGWKIAPMNAQLFEGAYIVADRRMIHRAVICSDEFIEMSYEAQALFYQLQIEADAYGLLSSVKKITRTIGVEDSVLQELINAGFVIPFGNGVIALTHWNVANTRKNDRTEKTHFPQELNMLKEDENKVYYLLESIGIQRVPMTAQNRVAQRSLEKNRVAQKRGEEESARGEEEILSGISDIDINELAEFVANGYNINNAVYTAKAMNTPTRSAVKQYLYEQQT